MKTSIVYLIMGLLVINSLSAQVKIGDNPQNLDPSSILELQSTNRVLVITRVTDAQMSVINPLPGAVVYNTDQECLHYYNGTEWINICEALDNSFTVSTRADSLRQIDPNARDNTIIITETTNPDESINYNFEVNRITGANIETGAVNGDKIQGSVVDTRHIVNQAVTFGKLQSGTNEGDLFMWNGSSWNFVNRSDLLNTQLDSIVGNEVVGPFDSTLERFGNGVVGDPYTLDVSEGGITNFEIATGAVDTDELTDDAVTTEKILNSTIATDDIANDAVTSLKILDGEIADADVSPTAAILGTKISPDFGGQDMATTGTLEAGNTAITGTLSTTATATIGANTITDVDGTSGQVLTTDGAGNTTWQDTSPTAVQTTAAIDGNGLAGTPLDLANDAVTTDKILDANVTRAKLEDGTANGQLMQWDAALGKWVLVDETIFTSSSLNSGQILVGDDSDIATGVDMSGDATIDENGVVTIANDSITSPKIAPGAVTTTKIAGGNVTLDKLADGNTDGQLMQWNAALSEWELVDETIFTSSSLDSGQVLVGDDSDIATGVDMSGDATIDQNGVVTIANDSITSPKIAPEAVTTTKIAGGNVTLDKLADGNTDGQLMQWDGTLGEWVLVEETVFASSSLNSGQILVGDDSDIATGVDMSGDATIDENGVVTIANDSITSPKIAPGAVTTTKIAGGNVTLDKLADGNTDGQLMQWNAALGEWELVDETVFASSSLNSGQILVGDDSDIATGVDMSGDATIDENGVVTIANDSITLPKLANGTNNGDIMQWDDTLGEWVLVNGSSFNQVTPGNGITVDNPTAQEFNVAVTNPVIAAGRFIGGVDNSTGATVTDNTSGSYTVNINVTPAPANYVVQLTTIGNSGARTIQVTTQTGTQFNVQIYDGSGMVSDSDWNYTVIAF